MHRQTVTHATSSSRHGYVLTGGTDGVVKFWKRTSPFTASSSSSASASGGGSSSYARCLEFVKSYTSHVGPILALVTSETNGDSAVSVGYDNSIKFYDVATFDIRGMIKAVGSRGRQLQFRLGRHAALIEREDLYLLISTRAMTLEESLDETRLKKELEEILLNNVVQDDGIDDNDDGPLPQQQKKDDTDDIDKMVPSGAILLFSGTNLSAEPLRVITHHAAPITAMAYHPLRQWVVSGDASGVLEIWNIPSFSVSSSSLSAVITWGGGEDDNGGVTSSNNLPFVSKFHTDLYALMKKKTYAIDIAVSIGHFAVYSTDRKIRLFSFNSGCKLVCIYDERMQVYDKILSTKSTVFGIDAIEYGKRAALEHEMEDAYLLSGGLASTSSTKQVISTITHSSEGSHHQRFRMVFDDTGMFLLIPTIFCIKVINIITHRVVATVGKGDASALRFIHLCLCPGNANINQQMQLARMGGSSAAMQHNTGNDTPNDSLLVVLAYGKRRFYAFSHYDPISSDQNGFNEPNEQMILARDILNEAPDASDLLEVSHLGRQNADADLGSRITTASTAILRTTHGDITIKLFKNTPRTIQNFVGHSQNGYYDNIVFHRIIPGFMIQTGDPLGDGTGGESIWGGEFEDEIRRDLRHDRPFTVSMANAGPGTNGSQFFITTVSTPWLDNKHTVFGRVVGGMEVVMAIESVKTDDLDRPLSEVKILSIDLIQ